MTPSPSIWLTWKVFGMTQTVDPCWRKMGETCQVWCYLIVGKVAPNEHIVSAVDNSKVEDVALAGESAHSKTWMGQLYLCWWLGIYEHISTAWISFTIKGCQFTKGQIITRGIGISGWPNMHSSDPPQWCLTWVESIMRMYSSSWYVIKWCYLKMLILAVIARDGDRLVWHMYQGVHEAYWAIQVIPLGMYRSTWGIYRWYH